jgi:hypothetical protein
MRSPPRQSEGHWRTGVVLAGVACLIACSSVLAARALQGLRCDDVAPGECHLEAVFKVQLALAAVGLAPAFWSLAAALRDRRRQAGIAFAAVVLVYVAWGVLVGYTAERY